MYIKDEKSMEDYIVNDSEIIKEIESQFYLKDVALMGRQVHIGTHNIIDILYEGKGDAPFNEDEKTLIIVELKFRPLIPSDLSQIGRYRVALRCFVNDEALVKGLLIGTGVSTDFAHLLNGDFMDEDIRFAQIKTNIEYEDITDTLWRVIDTSGIIDECLKKYKEELKIKEGNQNGK